MCCKKYLKDNKHNNLHLVQKYAQRVVLGHHLFLEAHSLPDLRFRKTAHFSEQIMAVDKYPCIFSRQMETIVYVYHIK